MNLETKKIICIRCPKGCEVSTTLDGYTITNIEGNTCKLGVDYVNNEVKDPRRILTTTVKVLNGLHPLVPVWTDKPIPKDKIFQLVSILKKIELEAPVELNMIVLNNIFDSRINVVTSGKVESK